jgi:hypothetical protein
MPLCKWEILCSLQQMFEVCGAGGCEGNTCTEQERFFSPFIDGGRGEDPVVGASEFPIVGRIVTGRQEYNARSSPKIQQRFIRSCIHHINNCYLTESEVLHTYARELTVRGIDYRQYVETLQENLTR